MPAPAPQPADRGLRASVVIPVRGGLERLAGTLRAVAGQDLPATDFEVIVVDDGTPGGGVEEVAREAAPALDLRVLRQEPAGPAAARNRGIDAARAPVVALLDADVLPRADWLRRGLAPFGAADPPAAVEGRTVVEPAGERTPFTHQTDNRTGGRYPTCNLFVSKPWLTRHGVRFDERYDVPFREDSDFAFQILACGAEIRWHPGAEVAHPPVPRGWTTPLRLARRYEMDSLLERRFPGAEDHIDRRFGVPGLRVFIYGMTGACEAFAFVSALLVLAGGFERAFVPCWIVCFLFWLATLLTLCGGRIRNARLWHLPALFVLSLLVPLAWWRSAIVGGRRFRFIQPFESSVEQTT